MKTKVLLPLLFVAVLSGCSVKPEEPEEPVFPISTSTNASVLLVGREMISNYFDITGGNGDYRVVYPKKLTILEPGSGWNFQSVDYSEDILKVTIKDGFMVVAELTYPNLDTHIEGYFMVEDAQKARFVFYVVNPLVSTKKSHFDL